MKSIDALRRQRQLLRMEYECEKEEFKRQTEAMGVARKVKRGLCWYPVRCGRSYYNSLNQLILEVERSADAEIEHEFEYGRTVCFFRQAANGQISYFSFMATVSFADESRMALAMPGAGAVAQCQDCEDGLGVQLFFDETSYQAMFEALDAVIGAEPDSRLAALREIVDGPAEPAKRDIAPVQLPWLNEWQQKAVNLALSARDVAVVHGPPGTGKTTTMVEAICETLRREPQALVCAQSNAAVDWIAEKLAERGANVLRIGNPSRVTDTMLACTYERRFADHPAYPELWAIRKEMRQLRVQGRRRGYAEREALRNRLSRLNSRAADLEAEINAEVLNSAHVVASTLVGSNSRLLHGMRFGTVFIDEAGQALEAACWIAIRKADRVVLAGDHQQLPPTIKCYEAARAGLDVTMMQRLAETKPAAVELLRMQYRMREDIMRFSSEQFYDGKVQAAPLVRDRSLLDLDTPIWWTDTSEMGFAEQFVGDSFGRINKPEADLLLEALLQYIERVGPERILDERVDFAIISPYRAQVQYIRQRLSSNSRLRPYRHLITVNTVDGFQGQERDVVMISLVRANAEGQIGFLRDLRRMNVAITRARMKVVLIGDAATLCRHPFYRRLLEYIIALASD